jgi:apolipoprotein N-acyltransferase
LQSASLAGVYALSFWVMVVNLLTLWAWIQRTAIPLTIWVIAAALPYLYGIAQVTHHDSKEKTITHFTAMLVQTAFSPEEFQSFSPKKDLIYHVIEEWEKILTATKKHHGKNIDLVVLPEFVVPYGTYSDVYPLLQVMKTFYETLGPDSLASLPNLDHPFMSLQKTQDGLQILVNNAYWTQALANFFNSDVIIGLEDAEDVASGNREYYSSAIFIHPQKAGVPFYAERYAKRVLVPMGEYIPFETCQKIAQSYGVFGSFTCGREAAVMSSNGVRFSPSICYEETYGNIIREGRQQGADLLVNLTSDVWFPNSKLPKQHLEHARLRTVENGVPLIRACNTGITAAIDSMGRNISILGGEHPEEVEWISDSLLVDVPIYSYRTFYSKYGDLLVIGFSSLILFLTCLTCLKKKQLLFFC